MNINKGTLLTSKFTRTLHQVVDSKLIHWEGPLYVVYEVKEFDKLHFKFSHHLTKDQLLGMFDYCPSAEVLYGTKKRV